MNPDIFVCGFKCNTIVAEKHNANVSYFNTLYFKTSYAETIANSIVSDTFYCDVFYNSFSIVCFEVQVVSITVCADNTVSRDLSDNSDIQRSGIISVAVSVKNFNQSGT